VKRKQRIPAMTKRPWTREEWIARLERLGPILWEEGQEGVAGWAVCPCCRKRELFIEFHMPGDRA
jgi:hypothetical protein